MFSKKFSLPIKLKRLDVIFLVLIISISYLLFLIFPYIFKYFLDNIGNFEIVDLYKNIFFVVLFIFFVHFVGYVSNYLEQIFSNRLAKNFQKDIVRKISEINVPDYEKMSKARVLNILTMDISVIYIYINLKVGLVVDFLKIVVISFILLRINFYLAILNFLLIPLYYLGNYFNKNRMEKLANVEMEKSDLMMEQIQDVVYKKTSINLFGAWKLFFEKFDFITDDRWKTTSLKHKFLLLNMEIPKLISSLTPFILLILGVGFVSKNILTIGTLVMFLQYAQMIYEPITSIASLKASANSSVASFERIRDFLNYENKNEGYREFFEDINSDIDIKNTLIENDKGETLFFIENLCIDKNGLYILKGDNGSGKTTLLNIIAGVYSRSQVKCKSDGYFKINSKYFDNMSYLYNPSMLFNGTVKENILLEKKETVERNKSLDRLIELFSAKEKNYLVTPSPCNLSLGEQQKLFLIRTFLQDKDIIFLDEPSSNLDLEAKNILRDYLLEISRDKIVILIAHDYIFEEVSDFIFEIVDKKLLVKKAD